MTTYSNAPTRNWNQPSWAAGGVLLTLLVVAGLGWFLLRSSPAGVLTAADVDGDWPFAATEAEVHCRGTGVVVDLDGTAYALSPELRTAPDLATFDYADDDSVWLLRDDGSRVPLAPVRAAAEDLCR